MDDYYIEIQKDIKKQLVALIERDDILICSVNYIDVDVTDNGKQQVEIEYVYVEK